MCGIVLWDQSYLDVLQYQLIPWHVRMLKHMAYAFIRVYLQNAYKWYCSPVYPIHITYHIRLCDYIHDRCKYTFICTWSHADLRMIAHVRPLLDAYKPLHWGMATLCATAFRIRIESGRGHDPQSAWSLLHIGKEWKIWRRCDASGLKMLRRLWLI